jgi:acetolactate synthase-1/2/3 large subunit
MTGAECLLRTLTAHAVDVCFMNPGTSEMQFVAALDRVPEMRGVLCLQEGVCSGAADGYARMLRRPAATLLHLGPGLANALSNFHNARKARSPIVNIVGEHSTAHMPYDAPLTADIQAFAKPVSSWVRTLKSPRDMGPLAAKAVAAALAPPGSIATLIIPADFSWSPAGPPGWPIPVKSRRAPNPGAVANAARLLLETPSTTALLLGGDALLEPSIRTAARIRAATGVRVFANRYAARIWRGRGAGSPTRIPYFPEPAEALLEGLTDVILAESQPPVSFFGYPGRRSLLTPENCRFHELASEKDDSARALEELATAVNAPPAILGPHVARPEVPGSHTLTPESLGAALAALIPEGAIVADEMVSSGEAVNTRLAAAAPHDLLPVAGGSIGQGLPVALGAAIACPHRKVICLEADGSAMYSLQALWTIARENLDVLTVIFANRRYRILDVEMERTGAGPVGPRANAMLDLSRPSLGWLKLAAGHGVESARAADLPEFTRLARAALSRRGPFLIEALL